MTQSQRVLRFLREHPGATVMELSFGLQPFVSNPRARISDLRAAGFVIEPTKRSDGKTGFVVRERSVTQGERQEVGWGGVRGPTESEVRDAAWAIVKDSKGMNETGHAAAVRWARAYLDLDDTAVGVVKRRKHTGHTHGYVNNSGVWTCVQDHYATGSAADTGCGATWTDPA